MCDANTGVRRGFLRGSKGDFTTFDAAPDAVPTIAEGINNAGTIVGLYVDGNGDLHGFVRSRKGEFATVDVDKPGASQTEINSINAKGEIVGTYLGADDKQHGFLGVPVR